MASWLTFYLADSSPPPSARDGIKGVLGEPRVFLICILNHLSLCKGDCYIAATVILRLGGMYI